MSSADVIPVRSASILAPSPLEVTNISPLYYLLSTVLKPQLGMLVSALMASIYFSSATLNATTQAAAQTDLRAMCTYKCILQGCAEHAAC